jgi:hypothetical protein
LQLSQHELEAWILEKFQGLEVSISNTTADFFMSGVDSLKAIQMRGLIVKHLDIGANTCGSMIVYDCGNAKELAEKLYKLRVGGTAIDGDEKEIQTMKVLINRYSTFQKRQGEGIDSPKFLKQKPSVVVSSLGHDKIVPKLADLQSGSDRSNWLAGKPYPSPTRRECKCTENILPHSKFVQRVCHRAFGFCPQGKKSFDTTHEGHRSIL